MFPSDLEVGYPDAITVFDELVAGDPAGGRRTFIIEDEPGIGRDIRLAFGAERQTIMLRPRIGGPGISDRDAAKDRLIGEAVLTVATFLTPGTLDDIAIGTALRAIRGGPNAVRVGQAGEAVVRAVVDIGPKVKIKIGGRDRIPDGLTDVVLTEVKNVNKLSYTRQLRDYSAHARQEGLTFHLWVKSTTKLSQQLEDQIANKAIIKRHIP